MASALRPNARGEKHHRWKGGVAVQNGYLRISAGPLRGQYVHILVMEGKLGGPIPEGKEVHHKDEDKLNPRHENLELIDKIPHRSLSARQRWENARRQIKGGQA